MGNYEHWTEEELEMMILKYRRTLESTEEEALRSLLMPVYEDMIMALEAKRRKTRRTMDQEGEHG